MPILASDIFDRARALLNDMDGELYINTTLLPFLKMANDELSDELISSGQNVQNEVSANINVLIGETTLDLPDDLIVPITLFERPLTSTNPNDFIQIYQRRWEEEARPSEVLGVWVWREQEIKFIGATTNRTVLLRYTKILTPVTGNSSVMGVLGSVNFLAYKTAELAARNVGMNSVYADSLEIKAFKHLSRLLRIGTRSNQALRTRRRGFNINNSRRIV